MSDLICRKTMTACQTPGMCKPHGGCQSAPGTETVDSAWLAQLRREFATMGDELGRVRAERDQFKAANGTLSAINEQRRNHLGNAKKAAGIEPDDDLVDAITGLVEDRRQRDLLGQAIADAAHKAGIIHANAALDGPMLLMLLEDLVGCVQRADTERKQLCAIVELTPELEQDGETLVKLVTQAKNAVAGATVAWEEQCARADELEAEAAMYHSLEYAAEHLPAGWLIQVTVEFECCSVELINPDGEDVAFPSNGETRAQEVRDAVDALINPEPEDDPGQPPAPSNWKAIAPPIADTERQCHDPECWCCDGTGRDPGDNSPCKWNNKLPF